MNRYIEYIDTSNQYEEKTLVHSVGLKRHTSRIQK